MPEDNNSPNDAALDDVSVNGGGEGADQGEIDALLAGAMKEIQGVAPPDEPAEDVPVDIPPQADTPPEPDGEPEAEETGIPDQAEIDKLLAEVGGDSTLDEKGLDQVIEAEGSAEADGMDQVVGAAEGDETLGPPTGDEEVEVAKEADADADADAESLDEHAQGQTKEEVGSENLAAAVPADDALVSQDVIDAMLKDVGASEEPEAAQEEEAPEAAQAVSEDELAEELADLGLGTDAEKSPVPDAGADESEAPEPEKPARRLPDLWSVLAHLTPGNLPKAAFSLMAGVFVAASVFLFLSGNQERLPTDEMAGRPPLVGLAQAMRDARILIESGEFKGAMDKLDAAMAKAPSSPDLPDAMFLRLKAEYLALPVKASRPATDRVHVAIDDFVKQAPSHPQAVQALRWKADLYQNAGVPYASLEIYRDILGTRGDAADLDKVLLDAARLALSVNQPEEAGEYLERLVQQFPGSPLRDEAKLMRGDAYVKEGESAAARELFEGIAAAQPNTRLGADAFARLGRMAFDAGKYEDAIALLENRLETATTIEGNEQVYLLLAKAYRVTGRPDEARRVLNELIEFFPETAETPRAFVLLSQVLDDLGMRKEAALMAAQAANRYPEDPDALGNHAEFLSLTGRELEAAEALVAADQAGADSAAVLLAAGRHFKAANDLRRARLSYERLVAMFGSSPQAFEGGIELAKVLYEQGQIRRALQQLEDLASVSEGTPRRLPVLIALGDLYNALDLDEPAAEVFERVAALTTEPEVLAKAAIALFDAAQTNQALAVSERVPLSKLNDATAYALLMRHGATLLRTDAPRGVDKMAQAYASYPEQRTREGDFALLKAYLTTDNTVRARALVKDIEAHVRQNPVDAHYLQEAAIAWADHLYDKGDLRAAAEAYKTAIIPAFEKSDDAQWAKYQRANALFALNNLNDSVALYEEVAQGGSEWAGDAKLSVEHVRMEQRARGLPVSPRAGQG
jgi:tetratricopeptide (TPR) repeat protein